MTDIPVCVGTGGAGLLWHGGIREPAKKLAVNLKPALVASRQGGHMRRLRTWGVFVSPTICVSMRSHNMINMHRGWADWTVN
jgi:hypothetical protein